jgi:hypothetical protein
VARRQVKAALEEKVVPPSSPQQALLAAVPHLTNLGFRSCRQTSYLAFSISSLAALLALAVMARLAEPAWQRLFELVLVSVATGQQAMVSLHPRLTRDQGSPHQT